MKILIVEDEPSLREVMQRALRQEGYVVETAATYAEADRRVSGYDYDCCPTAMGCDCSSGSRSCAARRT